MVEPPLEAIRSLMALSILQNQFLPTQLLEQM